MPIHSIISITHLELLVAIAAEISDSYKRKINKKLSFIHNEEDFNNENNIKINRILRKRVIREKSKYLLHWKNWEHEHNVWYKTENLLKVKNLIEEYKRRQTLLFITRRDKGIR